jgi:predicted nucleotidyltransferase
MRVMNHTEHGDRDVALNGEILRTVVGSGVHGIAIAGTDDHDEMGVYIEPPGNVVGIGGNAQHYVFRTQPEGARSGPGDTDLVSYSLHKYLRLAAKGNPTALLPLYAPADSVITVTPLGQELRALAPKMLSRAAVRRFLGYLEAQRKRLLGHSQGKMPNRPELVERYGYDVKYASHALRLAYQGLEVARDARLTLPMPAVERERVLAVKRGDVRRLDDVLVEIASVQGQVEDLLATGRTPLPDAPDFAAISGWAVSAHRRHWGWN